jgi:hypothetical protein
MENNGLAFKWLKDDEIQEFPHEVSWLTNINILILTKFCHHHQPLSSNIPYFLQPETNPKKLHPKQVPSIRLSDNPTPHELQQVRSFCLSHPITLVKNAVSAFHLNPDLFSIETILAADPSAPIDVFYQTYQPPDQNLSFSTSKTERKLLMVYDFKRIQKMPLTKFHSLYKIRRRSNSDPVLFGSNFDIPPTSQQHYLLQNEELKAKLPPFLRPSDPSNMLSHVGKQVLGVNTVQIYFKRNGSRTPGHQENGNFCSVNINLGAEPCLWFAVPTEYWKNLEFLVEKEGVPFLNRSWWPNTNELSRAGIPVFRFKQQNGDLVFVNVGCPHWVQALGLCRNISWNVGPMSNEQFMATFKRFEYNRMKNVESIVPFIRMCWNLAKKANIQEQELFNMIK